MKKFGILSFELGVILCTLFVNLAFSQDYEPTQVKFNWNGVQKYLSADSAYFQQNRILLGWQWGAHKKITQAVKNNSTHSSFTKSPNEWVENCNVLQLHEHATHCMGGDILNARGIQYEPTLLLDPDNPEKLVIRQGDTTRPVFGFLYRRGRILTDPTDDNFNRLIIDGDSVTLLKDSVILSDPWPSNALYRAGNENEEEQDSSLCRTLFISINLRRFDNVINNDSILKIELPYTVTGSAGNNIQFQSIPNTSAYPTGTFELPNGRGCIRDTVTADTGVRVIYITRQMLPPNSKDITISAYFVMKGHLRNNPELKKITPVNDHIDSIKIKITYLGHSPIAIDWVRLETPHTRRFLWGLWDNDLIEPVQDDINFYIPDYESRAKLFNYFIILQIAIQVFVQDTCNKRLIG